MSKMLSKDEVVEIIIRETDYSEEDIIKMINETIETMDNMVNEEGAAFVVANNLGVSINPRKIADALKINQLVPGQSNITTIGRLNRIYSVREFNRKDNTKGKVRNLEIIDNTGKVKISIWDMKTNLIEEKSIKVGDVVRISGGNIKMGYQDQIEITISPRGSIELEAGAENKDFPEIEHSKFLKLSEITSETKNVSVLAKIIDRQSVVEFERDGKKGKVTSLQIDDDTKKIRVVFWNELVKTALAFEKGSVVNLFDLRSGVNRSGELELTFANYSKIEIDNNLDHFSTVQTVEDRIITRLSEIEAGMKELIVTGKVVTKNEIRTFERDNNKNGKVASIIIRDKSQSMRVNLWGDATNYLESLEEGYLVRIHKAKASLSDFSGEIELSCNERSKIDISNDEVDADLFDAEIEFITFSDITMAKSGINILASITSINDPREITRNDGSTSTVKNLTVIDKNGTYGRIAAWDSAIEKITSVQLNDVLELINIRIKPSSGTYGPEIVVLHTSKVEVQKDNDDFKNVEPQVLTSYEKITLDKAEILSTQGMKISFKAKLDSVENFTIYDSCSECARKVYRENELDSKGQCDLHGEVTINPKMVLTLHVTDKVGSAKVTLFNDQAENLFGFTSTEAKDMIERLGEQEAPINKSEIISSTIVINGTVTYNENRDEYSVRLDDFEK